VIAMQTRQHGTGARKRSRFVFAAAIALLASTGVEARPAAGRVMAPARVSCDANHLTSYFGKVVGYKRGKVRVWLKIATDYDTIEEVTVVDPAEKDPANRFLYQGRPFTARDWSRIESKPGVLRKGTRATAWVCSDGKTPPLVDWNAAAE
jgi:hypothetical protein